MKRCLFTYCCLLFGWIGIAQNYTEYLTGNATDMESVPSFGICLMGGATESDEAMQWFLQKANGGDVVVLRASGSDGYNAYFFSELGVTINSVRTFVINNTAGAIDPYVLNAVANAEAIWFAGGDQFDYVSYFKNNAMETVLNEFINVKQGVIGGTSAGMAILGNHYFDASHGTVTSSEALMDPYDAKVSLGYNDFLELPFLDHVITDTHYDAPDRRGRHAVFMARFAQDHGSRPFGIACDEHTAVCIDANGQAHVYGDYPNYDDFAYFIQANCVDAYEPETCVAGQALNWMQNNEALKVYKVGGTPTGEHYFDLNDWTTENGGNWENWVVDSGVLQTSNATNPNCSALSIAETNIPHLKVYPNPFSKGVFLKGVTPKAQCVLYDVQGKAVWKGSAAQNFLDLKQLHAGVYFLEVRDGIQQTRLKLLKH